MRDGDLQARLTHAIRHEQLTLSYQPIVSLTSGRPSGAEALARWNDDELGPVSPDVFIPVAERSGLVHELGRWVLREACLEAMRWSTDPGGPSVSVNVSPVQLARSDVIRQVADALTESGLAPARLCLEITETAAGRGPRRDQRAAVPAARPGRPGRARRLRHRLLVAHDAPPAARSTR